MRTGAANDVTMTTAGLWTYGDWRHVATGCTAVVTFIHAFFAHIRFDESEFGFRFFRFSESVHSIRESESGIRESSESGFDVDSLCSNHNPGLRQEGHAPGLENVRMPVVPEVLFQSRRKTASAATS